MLLCLWIGKVRSYTYKYYFSKLIYKFIRIPVKIQIEIFYETWKADLKFIQKIKDKE